VVRRIIWSDRAFEDLTMIYDYIARDSQRYAQVKIKLIQSKLLALIDYPSLGRLVPELPDSIYREIIIENYRVIYRINDGDSLIIIIAIVHCRQMIENELLSMEDLNGKGKRKS